MRGLGLAGLQALLTVGVLAVLAVAPPSSGPMLLVSLSGMPPGEILQRAMPAGAIPLGQGPVEGSVIVRGERAAIAAAAMGAGIVVLTAPGAICGEEE